MRDAGPPPLGDTQTGRFVVVGLVMSLAFLLVAAAIWLASGGSSGRSEALAANVPPIGPPAAPAPVAAAASSLPASPLPLSSYPLPAEGLVMTDVAQTAPPAPPATSPPTVAETVAPAATVADTTSTVAATTLAPTTC